MCRWLVWLSDEDFVLSDVIFDPEHSLVHQSFNGGYHPVCTSQNNMCAFAAMICPS